MCQKLLTELRTKDALRAAAFLPPGGPRHLERRPFFKCPCGLICSSSAFGRQRARAGSKDRRQLTKTTGQCKEVVKVAFT
jgi:hypothetical protein